MGQRDQKRMLEMQFPTMMRAPAGESTQERRKEETPVPSQGSSDEKSFGDVIYGSAQGANGPDTSDLTDQAALSVLLPSQAHDMAEVKAEVSLRQGFSEGRPLSNGEITDVSILGDGKALSANGSGVGATSGFIGEAVQTLNALGYDIEAGDVEVPNTPSLMTKGPLPTESSMPSGQISLAVEADDSIATDMKGHVGLKDALGRGELGHSGGHKVDLEIVQATTMGSDSAGQETGKNAQIGVETVSFAAPNHAAARVSASMPNAISIESEHGTSDTLVQSATTGDVTDAPPSTPIAPQIAAVAAPKEAAVATASTNAEPDDRRGRDAPPPAFVADTPATSPRETTAPTSDKTTSQTMLGYAQVQDSAELVHLSRDAAEAVDFRLDGVSSTVAREAVQASVVTQVQKTDLPQHIAGQIAEAARQLPDRPVEITLSPEELGRVKLTFHVSETGAMSVVVQAERAETADLMRRHIHTLQQDFAAMGYEGSTFEFQQEGHGDPSDNSGGGSSSGYAKNAEQQAVHDQGAAVAPHRVSLNDNARVDIRL